MSSKRKIGEILVDQKIIDQKQLDEALEIQRSSGEFFGHLLIRKGWATEQQVLKALSDQFEIPFIRLELDQVDWSIAERFSPLFLKEHTCFPVKEVAGWVTIAISNPLDAWAESGLAAKLPGRQIKPVLSVKAEIVAAIRELNKRSMKKFQRSQEKGPADPSQK